MEVDVRMLVVQKQRLLMCVLWSMLSHRLAPWTTVMLCLVLAAAAVALHLQGLHGVCADQPVT
jgi:hypothetical protein